MDSGTRQVDNIQFLLALPVKFTSSSGSTIFLGFYYPPAFQPPKFKNKKVFDNSCKSPKVHAFAPICIPSTEAFGSWCLVRHGVRAYVELTSAAESRGDTPPTPNRREGGAS